MKSILKLIQIDVFIVKDLLNEKIYKYILPRVWFNSKYVLNTFFGQKQIQFTLLSS